MWRAALLRQLSKPSRHEARAGDGHSVIASAEPGERWRTAIPTTRSLRIDRVSMAEWERKVWSILSSDGFDVVGLL